MSDCKEHLAAMQAMATNYITPEDYIDRDGKVANRYDDEAQQSLFIADIIYMLDGPEQRAAFQSESE